MTNKRYKIRKELKMKKCRYCLTTKNLTMDHKIPKIQGGSDDIKNMQSLCKKCNGIKSGLSHKQVLRYAQWINYINTRRELKGKHSLGHRKSK